MISAMPRWFVCSLCAALVLGLGLLLTSTAYSYGIGGTGKPANGIGGTGAPLSGHEGSGIGGTGSPMASHEGSGIGGTGIVGVITAFGSIWVNGVEVHYPSDVQIQTPTGTVDANALAIGQLVLVSSDRTGGDQATARSLTLLPSVAGPVDQVASAGDRLIVAGQSISLPQGMGLPIPKAGDWVSVYGLPRSDGAVVATAISPYPVDSPVVVYGVPQGGTETTGLHIQGLPITLPTTAQPAAGAPLLITGQLRNGNLQVEQISTSPIDQLSAQSDSISIQGYVHDTQATTVTVGHLNISLAGREQTSLSTLAINQLITVEAHRDDTGVFTADRIEIHDLSALEIQEKDTRQDHPAGIASGHLQDESMTAIKTTEIHLPEATTPDSADNNELDTGPANIESPELDAPEVEVPEVEVPEVEVPEVEVPEVEVPEVDAPEFSMPTY